MNLSDYVDSGNLDLLLKLLQTGAAIAIAYALFRANRIFREAKDSVIQSKEEQIRRKDEQMKVIEKQNEILKILSAENVLKKLSSMKTMLEGRITILESQEEEITKELEKTKSDLAESQASGDAKAEEIGSLKRKIQHLQEALKENGIRIGAIRRSQHEFQEMRVKDVYGPIGAWFLMFRSRMLDEFEGKGPIYMRTEEAFADLAAKHKDDPEAFKMKMKELEAEAWGDYLDLTISEAIRWAGSNIQKPQNKKGDGEKNGEG